MVEKNVLLLVGFFSACSKIICRNLPLELVFIVDSSGSVGKDNFVRYVKPFVRDLVGRFTIAPDATRVGLVLYSKAVCGGKINI